MWMRQLKMLIFFIPTYGYLWVNLILSGKREDKVVKTFPGEYESN